MSNAPDKRFRRLIYLLNEVESSLREAGRPVAAASVGAVVARIGESASQEFLDECRTALEAVLLGERDLSVELIGQMMDVLATVDETLRSVHG